MTLVSQGQMHLFLTPPYIPSSSITPCCLSPNSIPSRNMFCMFCLTVALTPWLFIWFTFISCPRLITTEGYNSRDSLYTAWFLLVAYNLPNLYIQLQWSFESLQSIETKPVGDHKSYKTIMRSKALEK